MRLIGFKIKEGTNANGLRIITSIAPIVTAPPACDSETTKLKVPVISHATINIGIETEYTNIATMDTLSEDFFEMDGFGYCGEREYILSPSSDYAAVSRTTGRSDAMLIVGSENFDD